MSLTRIVKDSPLIVSLIINRNELAETGVTQAHGARTGGGTSWSPELHSYEKVVKLMVSLLTAR
jgi:hypothetical protein